MSPDTNQPLAKFKELVNRHKKFEHDEILVLAEELGKSLSHYKPERGGKENTRTQVRKFYNLVKVAQTAAKSSKSQGEAKVKVKLRTLQAQVTYAVARKTIGTDFKAIFDTSLNLIITGETIRLLDEFTVFFESLYAYFYYYSEENK